jgi:hypothetical protein
MYPDGGIVDVFVIERNGQYIVTDHGEGLGWLGMQSVKGNFSPNQRNLIDDVCQTLGVQLNRGHLVLDCRTMVELGEAIHLVGQAVVRVSDIWFTFRRRRDKTAADELREWFNERDISFSPSVKKEGRSGRVWTIDYQATTEIRTSLVFLLSTASQRAARRITDHVVSGCVDLRHLKTAQPPLTFVSLIDDTRNEWRGEDVRMLYEQSEVAYQSRLDELERILRPA